MSGILAELEAELASTPKPGAEQPAAPEPAPQPEPEVEADAPEAQAAESPEAGPDDDDELNPAYQSKTVVSHKALHKERERRKKLEADLQAERTKFAETMARAEERLRFLAMQAQQRNLPQMEQPKEPPIPDFKTDPIGHQQAKIAQMERELQQARQFQQATAQQQQAMVQQARLTQEVEKLEQAYAAQVPDYYDAQKYLAEAWAAEAQLAGYDPGAVFRYRTMEVLDAARQARRNPAELAYRLAEARGYKKPAPQQTGGQRIDQLAQGQARATSLSSAPGGSAASIGVDALLSLADSDPMAFRKATAGDNWQKLTQKHFIGR